MNSFTEWKLRCYDLDWELHEGYVADNRAVTVVESMTVLQEKSD
jgi:hypothetical protein